MLRETFIGTIRSGGMNRQLTVGVVAVVLLGAVTVGAAAFVVTDPLGDDEPPNGVATPGDESQNGDATPGDESQNDDATSGDDGPSDSGSDRGNVEGMATFNDSKSFANYVQRGAGSGGARVGARERTRRGDAATPAPQSTPAASADGGDGATAGEDDAGSVADGSDSRVGTTNVQVAGVDEPDLVKTDGEHFYYSPESPARPVPVTRGPEPAVDEREREFGTTHVVDVSEPADPALVGEINASGRQLLVGDTLVVLTREGVVGYDVSTPGDPTREWARERNGTLVAARATGGQVYLVVQVPVAQSPECPVEPMDGTSVDCGDIHHPRESVPVDGTYAAMALDPATGEVTDSVGFVGTRRDTAVYVSADSVYVTYTEPFDRGAAYTDALLDAETVPDRVSDRLREVRGYDLSSRAHYYEVQTTVENWLETLNETEHRNVTRQLSTEVQHYMQNHSREFTTTGIVRVDTDDGLSVEAHGTVPGRPLNQFSLDEYDGHLRIATTVPVAGGGESENDLYTLEATSLDRVGAVQGMGENQRIYAVRYVEETAYLVTFRRVDPFHVVDLADPADPVEQGVLELPGFSSYLHPVDDDHVLGIGEEDGRVKAVLFDVSDPTAPTIADSKVFDRGWSRVSNSHHAFTIDRRHGVFFLPAGEDGLVVDYTNESLSVETTVDAGGAVRARYVGDYLYVFGQREIAVVDENSWNRTVTLGLPDEE
jgi:inhibitor of cysteine peptidase